MKIFDNEKQSCFSFGYSRGKTNMGTVLYEEIRRDDLISMTYLTEFGVCDLYHILKVF